MMAPGHFAVAILSYKLSTYLGANGEPWLYIVAVLGGFLPDIDEPKSMVNSLFHVISKPVGQFFSHRGFTHSLVALIFLFWAPATLMDATPEWLIALWVGYASRLLADLHTKKGVPLLWPMKKVNIKNPLFHFSTNSKTEYIVVTCCAILTAYLWVYA